MTITTVSVKELAFLIPVVVVLVAGIAAFLWRRASVTRPLQWLSLFAFLTLGLAGQAPVPRLSQEETRYFKTFNDRVQAYVKMQKNLEASLSTLKPTKDVAKIVDHEHALTKKITDARRGARQGDIFTHEVTERFRKIIRREFLGPEGRLARRTIRQDEPSKIVGHLHVNDVYPEEIPLTTMPPTLLSKLPQLPPELAYRIVGRDLTLKDTKTGLIVDLIPNAIP